MHERSDIFKGRKASRVKRPLEAMRVYVHDGANVWWPDDITAKPERERG